MSSWDVAWAAITGGGLIAFGIAEYLGIRDRDKGKPTGTYSAALRRWFGIQPTHWRRWILGPLFGLGLGVLGVHILTPWL
jgi:hypothetical protein